MNIRFSNYFLFGVFVLATQYLTQCSSAPLNTDEEEARKFAQDASRKVFAYFDQLALDTYVGDFPAVIHKSKATLKETASKMIDIVRDAKQFDHKQFKDQELKNVFEKIIRSADEYIVGGDKLLEILRAVRFLEEMATDGDVEGYKNSSLRVPFFPYIQNIFERSKDPEELKYYWNAWREQNSEWALDYFEILINRLKEAANLTEIPPCKSWMKEHNITQMEHVMEQIKPFYQELHVFMRHGLQEKYGCDIIKSNALIPDHLFQQILAQIWTNESIVNQHFPLKSLPPYDDILKENNFDAKELYKMADKFYASLGLEPIPKDFWETRLKMKQLRDYGDCHASVNRMSSNAYMKYCHKMDFRTFLQAHGYMGEVYYHREKKNLPAYYFESYDLEYPIGEAVILAASTQKHLRAVGIVTDFKFTEDVLMNRLLRLSIHTMLNIPVHFVHTKAMADFFAGTVEMSKLNKHYWDLMEKYVGVEAPTERSSEHFDFPVKFYSELNKNKPARKFDSEILGYQFYKKLCSISGQYPKEPLSNCDFYENKEAGDALKKMMVLGSSKPFHEVLAAMLPEDPTINAESLLEYYSPVKDWIAAKNIENDKAKI